MKKINYTEAKQKFIDQGRGDVELLEKNYKSWKTKTAFLDKVVGEIFWACPCNVYNQQSSHPKRSLEQRKQTCLEKYGNECVLRNKEVIEKAKLGRIEARRCRSGRSRILTGARKITFDLARRRFMEQGRDDIELLEENYRSWKRDMATFLDKVVGEIFWAKPMSVYVQRSSHPKRIQEQRKQTCLEKYGVEYSSQSDTVKDKVKATNLERFGVEQVFSSKKVQEQIRKTNLEKYGTEYPSQNETVKEKELNSLNLTTQAN